MRVILSIFGSGQAIWTTKDYAALSEAGYKNCATVFACIKLIATAASRIEWSMSKKAGRGNWNEFDEHPLLGLLDKPNPREGGIRFAEKVFSFLLLNGNSYITKVHGIESMPPEFLYTLRPDRMKIISSGNWREPIGRYDYTAGAAKPESFKTQDILHLAEFHPTDDWYGLSRIEVAARQVDISNQAMEWNKKLLQNDMRAPGIVKSKNKWDVGLMKKLWRENYQGYDNTDLGSPIFLSGDDIEWQNISMPPKDVEWLNGQKFIIRQICSVFGVDASLINDPEYATLSNKQEARKGLYTEAVLPLMDIYRDELNAWLVPLYGDGLYLDYNRDKIEAIQEDRGKKFAYLETASFWTINEKRLETGKDEIEGGDVILVPISNIPLEAAIAPPEPPAKSRKQSPRRAIKAVKKSFWTNPERKNLLWKNFDRRLAAQERAFIPLIEKYLKAQADRVKAKLEAGAAPHMLFDIEAETKAYADRFFPHYEQAFRYAGQAGYRATQGKLWIPTDDAKTDEDGFKIDPEMLKKLREQIEKSARLFNETTWAEVSKGIEAAAVNNLTTEATAQELWKALGDRAAWEARRIASTEMTRTDGWGNHEGYKQNEMIDRQGWNCQKLATSREDHIEADGQEVGMDEDFIIGGEAMAWPGDDRASAGNVVNCRCSTYPVVGEL